MNNNKILWICGIAWLQKDNTFFPPATSPGVVSSSAFQQAIIEGLEKQEYDVKLLSSCDLFSGERIEWSHNGKSCDVRVAGSSNKYLRIPKKIIELFKELKKGDVLEGIHYACAYEMHLPYLLCLYSIKKKKPSIKTILICPDLNIYTDLNIHRKPIKAILKKLENRIAKYLLKYVDGYILFTQQMQDYFTEYQKPFAVVEGVYSGKYLLDPAPKGNFIMHAGSLDYNVGIENLIAAFEQLSNKSVELWFFGSGALDQYIKDKAKQNPRIKHMGFVDPKVLFEYEKQAVLLVNVRDPKSEYTKYSFPSKTFEYMASGTPFLTTDLQGIPQEYKEYLLMIESNQLEDVRGGLENALALTNQESAEFGNQARQFVLNNKNNLIQSRKLVEFLKNV